MHMLFRVIIFGTALAIGSLAWLIRPETALAMTVNFSQVNLGIGSTEKVLPVQTVGNYRYYRGRHGPRYRFRRGNFRHHYNGYWYAVPFWLGPAAVARYYYGSYPYLADPYYEDDTGYGEDDIDYGDELDVADDPYYDAELAPVDRRHVVWCSRRYRSYRRDTDSFRGYDGYDHRCVSPF